MYNWRLLLLAFFAVFQPIASFTERNLVDGRQQCCDHRLESKPARSLYGNSRLKLPSENIRVANRHLEVRQDERRLKNGVLSKPSMGVLRDLTQRGFRKTLNLETLPLRPEFSRYRENRAQIQYGVFNEDGTRIDGEFLRDTRHSIERAEDSHEKISIESLRRISGSKQISRVNREVRLSRDDSENRIKIEDNRRSVDSRREARYMYAFVSDLQRNRDTRDRRIELRRTRETNVRPQRTLNDQRIKKEHSFARKKSESTSENQATRFAINLQRIVQDRERIDSRTNVRKDNEFRIAANVGNRAYAEDYVIRINVRNDGTRLSERRGVAREMVEIRSALLRSSNYNIRERSMSANNRNILQIRDNSARNLRRKSVEPQRAIELTAARLSRLESRLTENRVLRNLNSRERVLSDKSSSVNDPMIRMQKIREQSRETIREKRDVLRYATYSLYDSSKNTERHQRRIQNRASRARDRVSAHGLMQERTSQELLRRENQRSFGLSRTSRSVNAERQINQVNDRRHRERAVSESSRFSQRNRYNTRDLERGVIRSVVNKIEAGKDIKITERREQTRVESAHNPRTLQPNVELIQTNNWKYLIYAIYLCSIIMPTLLNSSNQRKPGYFSWTGWAPLQKAIKID